LGQVLTEREGWFRTFGGWIGITGKLQRPITGLKGLVLVVEEGLPDLEQIPFSRDFCQELHLGIGCGGYLFHGII